MKFDALIVGAGPVGLTMACELARYGLTVKIIDKNDQRTDKSKAIVIWPRTLELIDRMGRSESAKRYSDRFVRAGLKIESASMRTQTEVNCRRVCSKSMPHLSIPMCVHHFMQGIWLVRPDGYVTLSAKANNWEAVISHLRRLS